MSMLYIFCFFISLPPLLFSLTFIPISTRKCRSHLQSSSNDVDPAQAQTPFRIRIEQYTAPQEYMARLSCMSIEKNRRSDLHMVLESYKSNKVFLADFETCLIEYGTQLQHLARERADPDSDKDLDPGAFGEDGLTEEDVNGRILNLVDMMVQTKVYLNKLDKT